MIYITQNSNNKIFVDVSKFKSLSNPTYLWSLRNAQSDVRTTFIPRNITSTYPSKYANKYDIFEFNTYKDQTEILITTGGTNCNLHLNDNNEYWLGIYEQVSSTNLDPMKSHDKLLASLAFIFVNENNTYYTGATQSNNTIYYGG